VLADEEDGWGEGGWCLNLFANGTRQKYVECFTQFSFRYF